MKRYPGISMGKVDQYVHTVNVGRQEPGWHILLKMHRYEAWSSYYAIQYQHHHCNGQHRVEIEWVPAYGYVE